LQINVLALVLRAGARVISYARIAQQLAQEFSMIHHAESVRGVVNRLVVRGFMHRKLARHGTTRGVRFSPVDALICPHITPARTDTRSAVRGDAQAEGRPEPSTTSSILREEKIDKKNLSLSFEETEKLESIRKLEALTEDDISFHWPTLARLGFGTHQIRQIILRLAQVSIGPERIVQGLHHAEWATSAGTMYDKNGEPVADPLNWTFSILAKQGYYHRPKDYVSPQEQAELDAAEGKNKLTAARTAHFEAAYSEWETGLSEVDRQTILTQHGHKFGPQHILLKNHFRATVWSKTEKNDAKKPTASNAGGGQHE
jgi:hypothetical protein